MGPNEHVPLASIADLVRARSTVRQIAAAIGFSVTDQTRLATSVSELSRNVLQTGAVGWCEIADESDDRVMQIRIVVVDHGPGIPDIEKAMQDGYSTSGGLGAGLPGVSRLMDSFAVDSRPGHTCVSISMSRIR